MGLPWLPSNANVFSANSKGNYQEPWWQEDISWHQAEVSVP